MGVEPTTTILETVALPLSYGSTRRSFYAFFEGFSTFTNFDGPKLIGYPPKQRRVYRPWRKPWRSGFDSRHGCLRSITPLAHLRPRSSTAIEHLDSVRETWVRFPSGQPF